MSKGVSLNDIINMWKKDCTISRDRLEEESLRIPNLHAKYCQLYHTQKLLLKKKHADLKKLKLLKYDYYDGNFSKEDYIETGWEQFDRKLVKTRINDFVEADQDYIDECMRVHAVSEIVSILESILKELHNRGFHIKNAIDFIKWTHGT